MIKKIYNNDFNDFKNTFSNDRKIINERAKYRIYCKCGHSILIYPFEHKNKKICSFCGKYVYINKKVEFKEKIENILRQKLEV